MTSLNLRTLEDQLRALRLADTSAIIISVGVVAEPGCGPQGAIQVVAAKAGVTVKVEALHLEDALLMAARHLRDEIERREEARKKHKEEK